jgi:membrane associated rhomboid family serine protease
MTYTPGGSLHVDRCISCKGVWLDAEEIDQIRGILTKKLRLNRSRRKLDEATRREQEMWEAHMSAVAEEESERTVSRSEWFFMFLTRLPLEVHNPVRRFPKAVIALMTVNVLTFVLQYFVLGDQTELGLTFIPASVLQFKQLHGIVTSLFLHGSVLHIAGNAYFLYTFGDNVEDFLGPLRFAALYFFCGIAANLAHFVAFTYSQLPTLGASGAISGILAAYMLVFPRRKIYWLVIIWPVKLRAIWYGVGWAVLQLANTASGRDGVAWYAHLGGFVAGLVFTKAYLKILGRPSTWA